jgi:hypothetical protein
MFEAERAMRTPDACFHPDRHAPAAAAELQSRSAGAASPIEPVQSHGSSSSSTMWPQLGVSHSQLKLLKLVDLFV